MNVPHDAHVAPILGAYFVPDAAAYYRLAVPLTATGGAVAPFRAMRESQVRGAETVIVSRFGATHQADVEGLRNVVRALREDAGRVIVDFDDDLFGQPAAYRDRTTNHAAVAAIARQADAITCTNSTLAGRLRKFNRHIRVIPNYIRPDDWPATPPPEDDPPTLVIAGSHTHQDDWRSVAQAIAWARQHYGARLRVCGHLPDYLAPICDDHRPWASLDQYPAMLAGGAIGLCPLPDSGFNRCKSPIKAYEYALMGLAVIASPCQYGPVLREAGLADYLVRDGGDWRRPLGALLACPTTRRQAADTLRASVRTTYDVRHYAAAIHTAYTA